MKNITCEQLNEVVAMLNRLQGELLSVTEHMCEQIDGAIEWLDDQFECAELITDDDLPFEMEGEFDDE